MWVVTFVMLLHHAKNSDWFETDMEYHHVEYNDLNTHIHHNIHTDNYHSKETTNVETLSLLFLKMPVVYQVMQDEVL